MIYRVWTKPSGLVAFCTKAMAPKVMPINHTYRKIEFRSIEERRLSYSLSIGSLTKHFTIDCSKTFSTQNIWAQTFQPKATKTSETNKTFIFWSNTQINIFFQFELELHIFVKQNSFSCFPVVCIVLFFSSTIFLSYSVLFLLYSTTLK